MIFKDDFLGEGPINTEYLFSEYDTEEKFLEFLKNPVARPFLEKYIGKDIVYYRNKLGHRTKEISNLNFDNYVLCTGCSMTEGTGINANERYSDIITECTGVDNYNLALAGTGIDVMHYNLTIWKSKFPDPKVLVVQWSYQGRTFSIQDYPYGNIVWGNRQEVLDFHHTGLVLNVFNSRAVLIEKSIRNLFSNTKIINVHYGP